jgi:FAD/FMN-containing dehydrogenase
MRALTTRCRLRWCSKPLIDFADANPGDYHGQKDLLALALPAQELWNADFWRKEAPFAVTFDPRPGASPNHFWWAGNSDEAAAFWWAYQSAWLPASLLAPQNQSRLVEAWFAASRHWYPSFHFNKGLFGAPPEARERAYDTATNPEVADAFALVIIAGDGGPAYQGMPPPDLAKAKAYRARINASMDAMLAAAPGAGAYVNECDYFQPDWQKAFWGPNYPRLLEVKRRYDPDGLFSVHHGVGEV